MSILSILFEPGREGEAPAFAKPASAGEGRPAEPAQRELRPPFLTPKKSFANAFSPLNRQRDFRYNAAWPIRWMRCRRTRPVGVSEHEGFPVYATTKSQERPKSQDRPGSKGARVQGQRAATVRERSAHTTPYRDRQGAVWDRKEDQNLREPAFAKPASAGEGRSAQSADTRGRSHRGHRGHREDTDSESAETRLREPTPPKQPRPPSRSPLWRAKEGRLRRPEARLLLCEAVRCGARDGGRRLVLRSELLRRAGKVGEIRGSILGPQARE